MILRRTFPSRPQCVSLFFGESSPSFVVPHVCFLVELRIDFTGAYARRNRFESFFPPGGRDRSGERDVSERIALGQAVQPTKQETLYDTRLLNQDAGMDSGFAGGDEKYNVYGKPLFAEKKDNVLYKYDKDRVEQGTRGVELGRGGDNEVADGKTVSVQFERDEDHDDFGIEHLHKRARRE